MQKRKCSDCGGELVLAVRASQNPASTDTHGFISSSFTSWRCGTCGSSFTAAQLRDDKRERAKASQPA